MDVDRMVIQDTVPPNKHLHLKRFFLKHCLSLSLVLFRLVVRTPHERNYRNEKKI